MTEIKSKTLNQAEAAARVLRPGIRSLSNGPELYRVAGGGSVVFRVFVGDQLRIIDVEGRQPGEVVAFANGCCNVDLLDTKANGRGDGLKKILISRLYSSVSAFADFGIGNLRDAAIQTGRHWAGIAITKGWGS